MRLRRYLFLIYGYADRIIIGLYGEIHPHRKPIISAATPASVMAHRILYAEFLLNRLYDIPHRRCFSQDDKSDDQE